MEREVSVSLSVSFSPECHASLREPWVSPTSTQEAPVGAGVGGGVRVSCKHRHTATCSKPITATVKKLWELVSLQLDSALCLNASCSLSGIIGEGRPHSAGDTQWIDHYWFHLKGALSEIILSPALPSIHPLHPALQPLARDQPVSSRAGLWTCQIPPYWSDPKVNYWTLAMKAPTIQLAVRSLCCSAGPLRGAIVFKCGHTHMNYGMLYWYTLKNKSAKEGLFRRMP